jgi:hypothetical protein
MLGKESRAWSAGRLLSRLRLGRPTLRDVRFAGVAIGIASIGCVNPILFGIAPVPDFLDVKPLSAGSYDVLLWWLPLFTPSILTWRSQNPTGGLAIRRQASTISLIEGPFC